MAGPKLVCFYRQIWKVQQGTGMASLKWEYLSKRLIGPVNATCDLLILGHKLHRKDGIAQPKGEVTVCIEENFSVKSDS